MNVNEWIWNKFSDSNDQTAWHNYSRIIWTILIAHIANFHHKEQNHIFHTTTSYFGIHTEISSFPNQVFKGSNLLRNDKVSTIRDLAWTSHRETNKNTSNEILRWNSLFHKHKCMRFSSAAIANCRHGTNPQPTTTASGQISPNNYKQTKNLQELVTI